MRVTEGMGYQNLLRDIARIQTKMQTAQEQLSSGKKISAPSDDPSNASDIIRINSEKGEHAQYERNLRFGQAKLNLADTVLDNVEVMVERARTLAQLSIGNPSAGSLNATEVNMLRDQIMAAANSTHAGRSLFAGSRTSTAPYIKNPDSSITYQGNAESTSIQVSRSQKLQMQIPGSEIFTGSVDIFDALLDLGAAMQAADNDAINAELQRLEQFSGVLSVTRSKIGGLVNMAANISGELSAKSLLRENDLTQTQAADLAKVISELTMNETALHATLAAGARISQLNLLGFLQ